MPDYKKMYFDLFNRITDVIETLQNAQQECEEMYIQSECDITPITDIPKEQKEQPRSGS